VNVLVLQHIACEPPGVFEDVLRERGASLHRVELDEGEQLPDWRGFDAIVAMGGPMSANDEAELPWLRDEKSAIAEAVRSGVPYWGACLGVQLLAAALGARVYPGPRPEVGVLPVRLTDAGRADPVFAGLPPELLTLQWHGDTFDLPDGATLLASSPAYRNQAFSYKRAYALQFHLEVSQELASEWGEVPAYAASLEAIEGPGALDRLVAEVGEHQHATLPLARELFGRWLELVVRVPQRSIG
jgi:GMP synthase (glutamine-hydrolysing)